MKMKKPLFLLFPVFFLLAFFGYASYFGQIQSASLSSVTVLLSNSRFSFMSALEGAKTIGSSLITIDTSNYPSTSVLQAQSGDVLRIGTAGNNYTVATTIDDANDNLLSLTSGLLTGDGTDDLPVYATQSTTMTVKLTTVSALTDGKFRILVPAKDDTSLSGDGVPDDSGFDFGSSTQASITCPGSYPTGYDSWSATSTASNGSVQLGGIDYHVFSCSYTGTGAIGTVFDGSSYPAFVISNLINPSPSTSNLGEADTYKIIVQHLDDGDTVVDQTVTKIGVIDAVRVSATIQPQLTFVISGVTSPATKCGNSVSASTTALAVPFGDITIGSFSDLAQVLTVTTNAANGYQVTAIENDQLGKDGQACTGDGSGDTACIVDANVSGMSSSVSADWSTVSGDQYGFGFTLGAATGGVTRAFYYNESSKTYSARHFADLAASGSPQLIFSRSAAALSDAVDVCYRLTPSALNVAGDYENYIVYTATATF
jgi:hypothetical protein